MNFMRMSYLLLMLLLLSAAGACSDSKQQAGDPGVPPETPNMADAKDRSEAAGQTGQAAIRLKFTLMVDGEVVDGSEEGTPLEIVPGTGQIMPAFEKEIVGLKPGDRKSFTLKAEDGFGPRNPEYIQNIPKAQLPADMTLEPGMTLQARTPEGSVNSVTVVEVRDDVVVMDFNHPLAGKDLNFDVEILGAE